MELNDSGWAPRSCGGGRRGPSSECIASKAVEETNGRSSSGVEEYQSGQTHRRWRFVDTFESIFGKSLFMTIVARAALCGLLCLVSLPAVAAAGSGPRAATSTTGQSTVPPTENNATTNNGGNNGPVQAARLHHLSTKDWRKCMASCGLREDVCVHSCGL